MGDSGSRFLVRLQLKCQLGRQSSEGLTGAKGSTSKVPHVAGGQGLSSCRVDPS